MDSEFSSSTLVCGYFNCYKDKFHAKGIIKQDNSTNNLTEEVWNMKQSGFTSEGQAYLTETLPIKVMQISQSSNQVSPVLILVFCVLYVLLCYVLS